MTDYYVDFSAGSNGVGSFASPWRYLSNITGPFLPGDRVWVRRKTHTDTVANMINWNPSVCNGIPIIGWPKSTDEHYAVRPAAAQAAWDGDSEDYATVDCTDSAASGTTNRVLVALSSAITYIFRRLSFIMRIATNAHTSYAHGALCINNQSGVYDFRYVRSEITHAVGSSVSVVNTTGGYGTGALNIGDSTASVLYNLNIRDCIFVSSVAVANTRMAPFVMVGSNAALLTSNRHLYNGGFRNCIFEGSGGHTFPWHGNAAVDSPGQCTRLGAVFIDCIFRSLVAITHQYFHMWASSADGTDFRSHFIRCKWDIPLSAGLSGTAGLCELQFSHYEDCEFVGCGPLNMSLRGSGNIRKLKKLNARTDAGIGIGGYGRDTLASIANVELVSGAGGKDISMAEAAANLLIVNSIIEGTGGYATVERNRLLLTEINNIMGSRKEYSEAGVVAFHGASRSGGAPYSIRFEPVAAGASAFTKFGNIHRLQYGRAGEEVINIGVSAGARTVTIYGAYIGYTTPPNRATVWAELDYPTATERLLITTRLTSGASLTADSSTWTGAGTVTPFKLELSFTAPTALALCVKVSLTAFDNAGAYVYIDPKPGVA